jgi:hypothetical protein
MLSNGLNYLFDGYWWLVYPPAIILFVTVVAFNLIGDAIRDSLDVRLQRPWSPGQARAAPQRRRPTRPPSGDRGARLGRLWPRCEQLQHRPGGVDDWLERLVGGQLARARRRNAGVDRVGDGVQHGGQLVHGVR